ncbi:MAG TPA: hypothetical protein VKX25_02230 [Bryobacteraceae bacterium]|jgi:hypothetical protein|nr:hypothetical protein [Bryobacteraceae bacterium]
MINSNGNISSIRSRAETLASLTDKVIELVTQAKSEASALSSELQEDRLDWTNTVLAHVSKYRNELRDSIASANPTGLQFAARELGTLGPQVNDYGCGYDWYSRSSELKSLLHEIHEVAVSVSAPINRHDLSNLKSVRQALEKSDSF